MKVKKKKNKHVCQGRGTSTERLDSFKCQVEGRVHLSESVFSAEPQTGDNGTNL